MVMKNQKSSQGRKKIAIAKIAKRSNLQVTFSKRRSGIFKKASELCTLCGVEIAIVAFSPSNKPFSFGHPNVESILDRYLISTSNPSLDSNFSTQQLLVDQAQNCMCASSVHELNMMLTHTQNELDAEKNRGQSLDKVSKAGQIRSGECWWENPIDELGLHELQILKAAMEELKRNVTEQVNKILKFQSSSAIDSSAPFFTMNGFRHDDRLFESKPSDQIGSCGSMVPASSAYNFGYGTYGHGLF